MLKQLATVTVVIALGGSVLPVASRSLVSGSETGQSYAEPLSRPLPQAGSAGRIVFNKSGPQGSGIFIMDADGTNVRQLAPDGSGPAFSLDGRKVAFVSGQPPSGCINNELNIMPSIFGTDQRPLTNVCGYDQHPTWSPDGTKLAFWSDRNAGEGLYVMNADGSNQTLVLSTSSIQRLIEGPHWSPDGTRIAFEGSTLNADHEVDIFVVNADGSNPTNITNTPTAHEYSPAWSRDSAKVSFSKLNGSANAFTSGDIWVMNATGGNQVKLTNAANDVFNTKSTWSPDNTRIAFASNPGNGNAEIYVMNADGSAQVNLSNSPGDDYYPDWQVAAPTPTTNPINDTEFFVRQHYRDFLNRDPDPAGLAGWQATIDNCPQGDTSCDRVHVSSAFYRSAEFQERGYFVYRFYSVSFGRKPDYVEFTPDLARVSGFLSDEELEAAKVAFIAEFMNRPAFFFRFNGLSNTEYVDTLLTTAGITHPARDFWIAALGKGTRTRAEVLREIAESTVVYNKYYNQAFVVMQYFGYLRRDPDALYINWIQVLDTTGDFRNMVHGFVNSLEYRFRFGP